MTTILDYIIIIIIIILFIFLIRTSNFGSEAERSCYFWQFEPEKFLLKSCS